MTDAQRTTDPRFYVQVDEDKLHVYDDDFGYDAILRISGDFGTG